MKEITPETILAFSQLDLGIQAGILIIIILLAANIIISSITKRNDTEAVQIIKLLNGNFNKQLNDRGDKKPIQAIIDELALGQKRTEKQIKDLKNKHIPKAIKEALRQYKE